MGRIRKPGMQTRIRWEGGTMCGQGGSNVIISSVGRATCGNCQRIAKKKKREIQERMNDRFCYTGAID